jgi:imidazole glycerol-phosphate synthase subunit HisH
MTIGVIDYGASNLRSVAHALSHLRLPMIIATEPEQLEGVEKVILPGVGAFGVGMDVLRERGFVDYLHDADQRGIPILGICLGMQFLLDESEEKGTHKGLGMIPGRNVRFQTQLKVPHMGWNQLRHDETHPLLKDVPDCTSYVYFVHSYHAADVPPEAVVATTDYGYAYPSIIAREHVMGVQFHPEKSQAAGLQILKNFYEMEG